VNGEGFWPSRVPIKLSRKALIKEQKAKLGQVSPAETEEAEGSEIRRSGEAPHEFKASAKLEPEHDSDRGAGGVRRGGRRGVRRRTPEPNFNRVAARRFR